MPEIRTGLDLCQISRMEALCGKPHFMDRVFTAQEQAYAMGRGVRRADALAGMWAAKEALLKALGTGIAFPMTHAEIVHGPEGGPSYALHGQLEEKCRGALVSLSITHEGDMAAAVCVLLRLT